MAADDALYKSDVYEPERVPEDLRRRENGAGGGVGVPPCSVVPSLAAFPGCRPMDGRRSRRGGKVASGGLRGYNGGSVFEKHCGTCRTIPLR